jgi:hypothetical protein
MQTPRVKDVTAVLITEMSKNFAKDCRGTE